ncbi:MAG: hypothetical protein D6689_20335 [Deltaproteobacteria bacterium]|nr:MAG: hypothetical protein D6689_20335 [Deltaproteobacteria bacterium]
MQRWRIPLILFGVSLVVFGATAGRRLRRQSSDPHFVYLADAWLHGRLAIADPPPAKGDDWAKVATVRLADGRLVRGRYLRTRSAFHTVDGDEIPVSAIRPEGTRDRYGHFAVSTEHYVSFPPFPAVLMIPQVLIHGRIANDVWPTFIVAALCAPLLFLVIRRVRDAGLCERTDRDAVWLSIAFAFGTVLYFSAVQGRVWYTAHVVGTALALGYLLCAIEARRPAWAGVLLGCAALSRVPLAFLFPLFACEAWRVHRGDRAALARALVRFAVPVAILAVAAMAHNYARFADPFEFGHSYLDVRQQANMETYGKFHYAYLSRNLAVALALLPNVQSEPPYVFINGHGLALWFTTPILVLVLWPRQRGPLHRPLWITTALVAAPTLLYMNSGWLQFGYRFSLDYMPLLFLLLAIGMRPLGRAARGLVAFGIAVNLFGAVTFPSPTYYDYDHYDVVVPHAPLHKRIKK